MSTKAYAAQSATDSLKPFSIKALAVRSLRRRGEGSRLMLARNGYVTGQTIAVNGGWSMSGGQGTSG